MPKKEPILRYKAAGLSATGTKTAVKKATDDSYDAWSKVDYISGEQTFDAIFVGDRVTENYFQYNATDGFEIRTGDGAVRLDDSGIRLLETGAANSYISWKETDFETGDTIAYSVGIWEGGAGDDIVYSHIAYKAAGVSAGDAILTLSANDVDASSDVSLTVNSAGYVGSVYPVYAGEFVALNANMTRGITINQGTNDNEIFALKSYGDVAHGATDVTETDCFGTLKKVEGAAGGLAVRGHKDSGGVAGAALQLQGWLAEDVDYARSTSALGIVHIEGFQTSGASVANTIADGNIVVFRTWRGGAAVTTHIFDEDGDVHLDGVVGTAYDDYDDALAVQSLAHGLSQRWDDTLRYNFDTLREMGVISGGDREHPFVSTKRLNALLMGAIGQLYERLGAVERELLTA